VIDVYTLSPIAVQFIVAFSIFVISFYIVINAFYLLTHGLALLELRDNLRESRWNPPFQMFSSPFYPGIGVVVPAFNEEATISESVQSMLSLNYPDLEIVVVNDGSTDETLAVLVEQFDLEAVDAEIPVEIPSAEIHQVYRSTLYGELLVIDKENGGKSDALNAGIWLTDMPLFCAVDSDTLIDRDALLKLVRPFLERPNTAVASGGVVRIANECTIEDGIVQSVSLPKTGLPGLQVMEYLRAFYSGRLGLNRLNGLILISGAFGLFETDTVREIGGYRQETTTEDFDIVVRLHRYLIDNDREYSVDFVPDPVAWTEVPSSLGALGRQRRRWYRGMVETVVANRGMLFNPTYGRIGAVVLPLFIAAEMFGRLIEGLGYLVLPVAVYLGVLNIEVFLAFLLLTTGFGVFLSWFGIFSEVWSFNRYDSPRQILRLLWYGVLENFGYRQWRTVVAWRGLFQYLRGVDTWGAMERTGFETEED
jgi:cellulose synthase/poly-beta-1,6-N-acetylglucosamine synthase-like glycosyltransferase